jgi:hypothetical protein
MTGRKLLEPCRDSPNSPMKKTPASCFLPSTLLGFASIPGSAKTPLAGRRGRLKPPLQKRVLLIASALAVGLAVAPLAVAEEAAAPHWVGTWSSSPQPIRGPDFIGALKYPRNLWNQTVRQVSRVSIGGPRIRVVLSNEYGQTPATIGAARVALSDKGPAIVAGSDRALVFGGRERVTIPPGQMSSAIPLSSAWPRLEASRSAFSCPK